MYAFTNPPPEMTLPSGMGLFVEGAIKVAQRKSQAPSLIVGHAGNVGCARIAGKLNFGERSLDNSISLGNLRNGSNDWAGRGPGAWALFLRKFENISLVLLAQRAHFRFAPPPSGGSGSQPT